MNPYNGSGSEAPNSLSLSTKRTNAFTHRTGAEWALKPVMKTILNNPVQKQTLPKKSTYSLSNKCNTTVTS
jgi:hypothetical protein